MSFITGLLDVIEDGVRPETGWLTTGPELMRAAVTLQRMQPYREAGMVIFERLLALGAHGVDDVLFDLDARPRRSIPGSLHRTRFRTRRQTTVFLNGIGYGRTPVPVLSIVPSGRRPRGSASPPDVRCQAAVGTHCASRGRHSAAGFAAMSSSVFAASALGSESNSERSAGSELACSAASPSKPSCCRRATRSL